MISFLTLASKMLRSNFPGASLPYKLTLIVTYQCCLKCKMCNIWQRPSHNEMTLDEYERFFKANRFFNWINMSGGEIFLREDVVDIVRLAQRYCKGLYLLDYPTSGILTDKVIAATEGILGNDPKKLLVTISLDGPPALHDEIRGVSGAWDKAVATFKALRKINRRSFGVYFGMTLSAFNQDRLDDTFEALRQVYPAVSYRDIHINVAHQSAHYYGNDAAVLPDTETLIKTIDAFGRKKGFPQSPVLVLEWLYLKKCRKYLMTHRTPVPCKALKSSCFVDPYGDVFACSMFEAKAGALREYDYDLRTILALPETRTLREAISRGNCPQCWTPCEAYQSLVGNIFQTFQSPDLRV